jgi:hypothetical protein
MSPNFAARWFEIDPTYFAIRTLAALDIVQLASNRASAGLPSPAAH